MPHLIQLVLPLCDNDQRPLPQDLHAKVKTELMWKFGGLTTYSRIPADGLWATPDGHLEDQTVAYEVLVWEFDEVWWSCYRHMLERRFPPEEVVVRAQHLVR